MKRAMILTVGALVCVASGVVLQRYTPLALLQTQGTARARQPAGSQPPAPRAITVLGRLEPLGDVIDVGAGAGSTDRLERLLVAEGQHVEAEQELAYLESYQPRLAEKHYAASQLSEAQARLASEVAYAEALIKEAKIAVASAEKLHPLEIEAQEAKVRLHETELAHARRDLKRMTDLRASEASTQQEVDQQAVLEERRGEELHSAQITLRRLKAVQELDLAKAKAQLTTANAALVRARDVQPIDSLTKGLQLADARLKQSVIRAPCSGKVLKIRTHPGEAVGTKPILRLGDTAAMGAVAEVYYTEARFVTVGQKATVTSPALPDALHGTVVAVGSMIHKNDVLNIDPTADVDARVIEVRIQLEPNELASRLVYLQVNVRIEVDAEQTP